MWVSSVPFPHAVTEGIWGQAVAWYYGQGVTPVIIHAKSHILSEGLAPYPGYRFLVSTASDQRTSYLTFNAVVQARLTGSPGLYTTMCVAAIFREPCTTRLSRENVTSCDGNGFLVVVRHGTYP